MIGSVLKAYRDARAELEKSVEGAVRIWERGFGNAKRVADTASRVLGQLRDGPRRILKELGGKL
ncbi:MAG: hypothetical protein WCA77_00890 [Thermoplasmata archaeon]